MRNKPLIGRTPGQYNASRNNRFRLQRKPPRADRRDRDHSFRTRPRHQPSALQFSDPFHEFAEPLALADLYFLRGKLYQNRFANLDKFNLDTSRSEKVDWLRLQPILVLYTKMDLLALPELQFKMLVEHNIVVPTELKQKVLGEDIQQLKMPLRDKSRAFFSPVLWLSRL